MPATSRYTRYSPSSSSARAIPRTASAWRAHGASHRPAATERAPPELPVRDRIREMTVAGARPLTTLSRRAPPASAAPARSALPMASTTGAEAHVLPAASASTAGLDKCPALPAGVPGPPRRRSSRFPGAPARALLEPGPARSGRPQRPPRGDARRSRPLPKPESAPSDHLAENLACAGANREGRRVEDPLRKTAAVARPGVGRQLVTEQPKRLLDNLLLELAPDHLHERGPGSEADRRDRRPRRARRP